MNKRSIGIVVALGMAFSLAACSAEPESSPASIIESLPNVESVEIVQPDPVTSSRVTSYSVVLKSSLDEAGFVKASERVLDEADALGDSWSMSLSSGNRTIGTTAETMRGVEVPEGNPDGYDVENLTDLKDVVLNQVRLANALIANPAFDYVRVFYAPKTTVEVGVNDPASAEAVFEATKLALGNSGIKNLGDFSIVMKFSNAAPGTVPNYESLVLTANANTVTSNDVPLGDQVRFPGEALAMYRTVTAEGFILNKAALSARGESQDFYAEVSGSQAELQERFNASLNTLIAQLPSAAYVQRTVLFSN